MAFYQAKVKGELWDVVSFVERELGRRSQTISLEHEAETTAGDVQIRVAAFERYSWMGGNRVSLNITYIGSGGEVEMIATSTGGSQAMFYKLNTIGEENFMQTFIESVQAYSSQGW